MCHFNFVFRGIIISDNKLGRIVVSRTGKKVWVKQMAKKKKIGKHFVVRPLRNSVYMYTSTDVNSYERKIMATGNTGRQVTEICSRYEKLSVINLHTKTCMLRLKSRIHNDSCYSIRPLHNHTFMLLKGSNRNDCIPE